MRSRPLESFSEEFRNKVIHSSKKDAKNYLVDTRVNAISIKIHKGILSIMGFGITLANNEIKVIRSLENSGILLKGTTIIINSQEAGLLNFPGHLMRAGSPLMKNVITPSAKSVLIPLRLTAVASATNAAIQNKVYGSGMTTLII